MFADYGLILVCVIAYMLWMYVVWKYIAIPIMSWYVRQVKKVIGAIF
jgi:hypothetical protein